jgi:diaminopimelate decarboxylase
MMYKRDLNEQTKYELEKPDELATPYFLIDEKELQKNISNLKSALHTYWDNYIIGYSFKTNSLPWLVNYLKNSGFYAEVVSDDEYKLAETIGYDKHKFVYNGPHKSEETFLEAIKNGCIVNIDSLRELKWLKELDSFHKYEVGIRVNFELERLCPNESASGKEGGRFGFCYENGELKRAIGFIGSLQNVKIAGIHLHCSTKTRSLNIYRAISKIACEIKRAYALDLKYVDVGGGFYGGLKDTPQFSDYMEVISSELVKEFDKEKTTLILEPGTSIASSPFSFVTSVIDVKQTTVNNFVVTDGSRIYVDPLMTKSRYFFKVENKDEGPIIKSQVVSGFTCMENDRLFVLDNYPQLSAGDKIIYEKVGAYTMCLSPLFIKYFPDVYVEGNNGIYHVRDRWTAKEYIQNARGC